MKKRTNFIIIALLLLWLLPGQARAAQLLIPVGQVVGLELQDQTVTIAAFDETMGNGAKAAGMQVGDRLLRIDGKQICCTEDVRRALEVSGGTVVVALERDGKEQQMKLTPEITPDGPKLGIYLRQGVTGIGTVTFYDPASKKFGTLGHGVNDAQGKLLSLTQGNAYQARVMSVNKGKSGEPGQLMGAIESREPAGTLTANTPQGVFGISENGWLGDTISTGEPGQVHTGPAVIRSTVSGNTVREYSVEILKVYPKARASGRNLLLKVTDPALLEATGGIVQGMSGSPIIQDGKLVGAVTHVLVNDPTRGYGIFIENMLEAAE